jgi:hypothetical protein
VEVVNHGQIDRVGIGAWERARTGNGQELGTGKNWTHLK